MTPDEPWIALLSLAASFPASAYEQARSIDAWRVVVTRPGQGTVLEESGSLSPNQESVTVQVSVTLQAPCERLMLSIELLAGGEVWYRAERENQICAGSGGGNQLPSLQLDWVGPIIGLMPEQLSFSADQATNPSPQTYTVSNSGGGTLNWTASGEAAWLTVSPSSGSLGPGASQSVTATITSSNLDSGQFLANVVVTDPNAANSPRTLSISLTVIEVTNSVVHGVVSADGAPLPGVTVTLAGKEHGSAVTDQSGAFSFTGLTSGSYTIAISGFPSMVSFPSTSQAFWLGVNQTRRVDFQGISYHALTVTKAGAGSGTVTSSPAGINCGTACAASYASGTVVTLTASPSSGSVFAGWSGACTGAGSTCQVSMNAAKTVTATFNAQMHTLTVTKVGAGSGTVTSSPAGINCGSDCSENYSHGTAVYLSATASVGSTFDDTSGWVGCTGFVDTGLQRYCVVTMDAAKTVTATFNVQMHTLTVTKAGTGMGTVTSSPAGINCGTACSTNYAHGTTVTLTAAAAIGSMFTGWSGACSGAGSTCQVTMDAAKTVTATFSQIYFLTVTKTGTGSGTVTSSPTGINCGSTCSAIFVSGTTVTLTATASAGSWFYEWSGDCTGTSLTCQVTMSQNRNVTATFLQNIGALGVEWGVPGDQPRWSNAHGRRADGDGDESDLHQPVRDPVFPGRSNLGPDPASSHDPERE